jgi:ATP-dependent DNA helicase RecQ
LAAQDWPEHQPPLDRSLLQRLRQARDQWAAEARLPAYQILHNSALEGLARIKPRSLDEMLAIKGIGPVKAERYGRHLLEIINGRSETVAAPPETREPAASSPTVAHPRGSREPSGTAASPIAAPNPTAAPHREPSAAPDAHAAWYWTWRLLERGFTQLECAAIRGIDESVVLEHALRAARDGHCVPLDAFLTTEDIEALTNLVGEMSGEEIGRLVDQLPENVLPEHVQLYILSREH